MKTINNQIIDNILKKLEKYRCDLIEKRTLYKQPEECSDYVVEVCQSIIAKYGGYKNRDSWKHLQKCTR